MISFCKYYTFSCFTGNRQTYKSQGHPILSIRKGWWGLTAQQAEGHSAVCPCAVDIWQHAVQSVKAVCKTELAVWGRLSAGENTSGVCEQCDTPQHKSPSTKWALRQVGGFSVMFPYGLIGRFVGPGGCGGSYRTDGCREGWAMLLSDVHEKGHEIMGTSCTREISVVYMKKNKNHTEVKCWKRQSRSTA